ncbi:benzoate/H(+) symporter BenE family transporter [Kocuria indica]|uniref:benzoate/H(+) symporter BenE family transporter n=1 Tax=Kocuria marina TaxID=223184 RepID=UPI001EF6A6F7|nr:benzoate/H(+) symporter BenE family transporter [Kocuria indica]
MGAYVVAALVSLVLGATGLFGKLLAAVPQPITAGVLTGVLLPFAVQVAPAVA